MTRVACEADLFEPVRDHLVARGYTVRAEVDHCDIIARRGEDLIVVELKRRINLELLIQATDRQRITPSVYVAVPGPLRMDRKSRFPGLKRVLRSLELGLLIVAPDEDPPRVEVVFHPLPYQRQKRKQRRRAVLREMEGRSANHNRGGVTRRKLITAYRENAIQIGCALQLHGPLAPRQLRTLGTGEKTLRILADNHYGWFERIARGLYAITATGRRELKSYGPLVRRYRNALRAKTE